MAIRNLFGLGGDESDRRPPIEKAIAERGIATLKVEETIIVRSEKAKVLAEGGKFELYLTPEVQITANYPLLRPVDGVFVFEGKEGRQHLKGGEAKVAVMDTAEYRVVTVLRPSDEHFSQDAVGVGMFEDQQGNHRIGIAVWDGKTRIKATGGLPLIQYGKDKDTYYSSAERYANRGAATFPRRLAFNRGTIAEVIRIGMEELDEGLRKNQSEMGWGVAVGQLASIQLDENGAQMHIEVVNMGAVTDLGENRLSMTRSALGVMGNSVQGRDLEYGSYGTYPGFKPKNVHSSTRGAGGSRVATVTPQIYMSCTDGFVIPEKGISVDGSALSLEKLLSLPPSQLVGILQEHASDIFGESHDDGTFVAVVPKSVLAINGFKYNKMGQAAADQVTAGVEPTLLKIEAADDEGATGETVVKVVAPGPPPEELLEEPLDQRLDLKSAVLREERGTDIEPFRGEAVERAANLATKLGIPTEGLSPKDLSLKVLYYLDSEVFKDEEFKDKL